MVIKNLKEQIRNLGHIGEEAKKKAQQTRLDEFKKATEALEKQYGCFYDAVIQPSPKGIFPVVIVNAISEDEFQRIKQEREQPAPSTPGPAETGHAQEAASQAKE